MAKSLNRRRAAWLWPTSTLLLAATATALYFGLSSWHTASTLVPTSGSRLVSHGTEVSSCTTQDDSLRFAAFVQKFGPALDYFEINTAYLDSNRVGAIAKLKRDDLEMLLDYSFMEFGRGVPPSYRAVARLQAPGNVVALVYASQNEFGGRFRRARFHLATYHPTGRRIDQQEIACNCSAENISTLRFAGNELRQENKKRLWARPLGTDGPEQNIITGYQNVGTACWTLQNDGEIIRQDKQKLALAR